MVTPLDIFIILFVTLGPLKIILPFTQLTKGTDAKLRRSLAQRACGMATAIVIGVALLGTFLLEKWHVSIPAIAITGSIFLFYQAFQIVMGQPTATPATLNGIDRNSESFFASALSFLIVPTIVTAPGIAAIVALMGIDRSKSIVVIVILLAIVAMDLLSMLNSDALLKRIPLSLLKVIGWIFAILQAMLATQIIINNLPKLLTPG